MVVKQVYHASFPDSAIVHAMVVQRGQHFDTVALAWLASCGRAVEGIEFIQTNMNDTVHARVGRRVIATFTYR
jgi:hypothetical protein